MNVTRKQMACLEVSSWRASVGGEHYYGYIYYYDADGELASIQLNYSLTKEQADYLNKKDGLGSNWEAGEPSNRYFKKEKLEEDAIKVFHSVLVPMGYKLLRVGNFSAFYPERTIAWAEGCEELAIKINDLYKRGERYDWDWDRACEFLDSLCAKWEDLFTTS